MTEEEAQGVLDHFIRRLIDIGEQDIGDQTSLVERDENGFLRPQSAKERLVETIEALERTMALDDIATYKAARRLLVENVDDASDVLVVVRPSEPEPQRGSAPEGTYYIADGLTDLSEERAHLRKVAEDLRTRFGLRGRDDG